MLPSATKPSIRNREEGPNTSLVNQKCVVALNISGNPNLNPNSNPILNNFYPMKPKLHTNAHTVTRTQTQNQTITFKRATTPQITFRKREHSQLVNFWAGNHDISWLPVASSPTQRSEYACSDYSISGVFAG